MNPSIAVVIAHFDQSEHLARALTSAIWQLGPRDEVIVVDDGSTHAPQLEGDKQIGDKVLWLRNAENRGVSYSRNRAILRSGADWIKFLDADDVLAPFCLNLIRKPGINQSALQLFSGGIYRIVNGEHHDYVYASDSSLDGIKSSNPFLPSAVFVRRAAVVEVGMFDEEIDFEEDWDLWLRLHERFDRGAFALSTNPVCYYWIDQRERNQKARTYTRRGIPVREYFRERYGVQEPV